MARTIAKDHDQKRGQILKCAARVFAEDGFDRASMNRLARACGISKANIYHYYDGKDAILFDLLDSYLMGLRDQILAAAPADAAPEARLRATVAATLGAYQGADNEHKVQVAAMGALPEAQQARLRAYQRDMVAHLSAIVARLSPDVFAGDPARLRATTMSVFGMLNWYYMWNAGAGTRAREDYARLVADLTLNGVRGF